MTPDILSPCSGAFSPCLSRSGESFPLPHAARGAEPETTPDLDLDGDTILSGQDFDPLWLIEIARAETQVPRAGQRESSGCSELLAHQVFGDMHKSCDLRSVRQHR